MAETRGGKPIVILLVEDNPGDVDLARAAMEDSKVRNILHSVGDGKDPLVPPVSG